MLRKRTRSLRKDQSMSDSFSGIDSLCQHENHNHKTNPLFSVPGLFVGLSSKALTDSDSVRSPTSPLEFRVFSRLGNSFKSPRSVHDGHQKSQGACKVGLGIIDSLDKDVNVSGNNLLPSESKNILFGPKIRSKTSNCKSQGKSFEASRSLPNNFAILSHAKRNSPLQKGSSDVVFEIGDTPLESKLESITSLPSDSSVDSNAGYKRGLDSRNSYMETVTSQLSSRSGLNLEKPSQVQLISSSDDLISSLSASEIELSEDYTCVISHGPNPKTTHIFCDCVLEDCQARLLVDSGKKEEKEIGLPQASVNSEVSPRYPSNNFLSMCHFCNKKLQDGEDIYIYRGDTSFCSVECRCQGIFIEEKEKSTNKSNDSPKGRKLFEPGVFVEL